MIRNVAIPVPSQVDDYKCWEISNAAVQYWTEEITRLTGLLNFAKKECKKQEEDLRMYQARLQKKRDEEKQLLQAATIQLNYPDLFKK